MVSISWFLFDYSLNHGSVDIPMSTVKSSMLNISSVILVIGEFF